LSVCLDFNKGSLLLLLLLLFNILNFSVSLLVNNSDIRAFVYRRELSRHIPIEHSLLQGAQKRECFLVYSNQQMSVL